MEEQKREALEALKQIKKRYNFVEKHNIKYRNLEGFVKCNGNWLQVYKFSKKVNGGWHDLYFAMTAFLTIKNEDGFIESIIFYAVDASLFYIYEYESDTLSTYRDTSNIKFGPRIESGTCDSIQMFGFDHVDNYTYLTRVNGSDDESPIVHGPNTMMNVAKYIIEKDERDEYKLIELGTMFQLFLQTQDLQIKLKVYDKKGDEEEISLIDWMNQTMNVLYDKVELPERNRRAEERRHLYPTGSQNAEPSSSRLNTALAAAAYVSVRVVLAPIAIPLAPLALLARGGKESKESKECKRYILYNKRRYVVLKEGRKSYIVSKSVVVYLSEIRGKYDKWGMLAACGGSPRCRTHASACAPPTAPIAGKSKDA